MSWLRPVPLLLLLLALPLAACDDQGDPPPSHGDSAALNEAGPGDLGGTTDGAAAGDTGSKKSFGDTCTDDSQCESNVCHDFGDGTQACTTTCTDNNQCPSGSQGQKCNNKGVCRT